MRAGECPRRAGGGGEGPARPLGQVKQRGEAVEVGSCFEPISSLLAFQHDAYNCLLIQLLCFQHVQPACLFSFCFEIQLPPLHRGREALSPEQREIYDKEKELIDHLAEAKRVRWDTVRQHGEAVEVGSCFEPMSSLLAFNMLLSTACSFNCFAFNMFNRLAYSVFALKLDFRHYSAGETHCRRSNFGFTTRRRW